MDRVGSLRAAIVDGSFHGIQRETCTQSGLRDETRPGGDMGEVRHSEPIGRSRVEFSGHVVDRARHARISLAWRNLRTSRCRAFAVSAIALGTPARLSPSTGVCLIHAFIPWAAQPNLAERDPC